MRLFVICTNGSFRFVLSLLTALSFLFLSFRPFSPSLPPSLASFENKNVKRYNVRM